MTPEKLEQINQVPAHLPVRISPSGFHLSVELSLWDVQHLRDQPSVLPKENNFPMLPIAECRYIDPQMTRGGFPRPPAFQPFSDESLRNCPRFRWLAIPTLA
jgi:hypothetical protein